MLMETAICFDRRAQLGRSIGSLWEMQITGIRVAKRFVLDKTPEVGLFSKQLLDHTDMLVLLNL